MKTLNQLFIMFIFLLLSSCGKEKTQVIPEIFEKYVHTFFEEANLRDVNIQLEDFDLEILLTDIEDSRTLGNCNSRNHIIQINEEKWERLDEAFREYLIFHELGHCILDRPHKNERSENEECFSYMGGDENNFKCSMNRYSELWRNFYLDELFNPQEELPNWYTEGKSYNDVFEHFSYDYEIIDSLTNRLSINDLNLTGNEDYTIELECSNWKNVENSVYLLIDDISFAYCDKCTIGKIKVHIDSNKMYSTDNISFAADETILTVQKIGDLMNFYINERFIHTVEKRNQTIERVETKYHDNQITMSLKIQRQ